MRPDSPVRAAAARAAGLPLWLKLAGAVVCLAGTGLAVLGVAGALAFRGYLIRQTDQQVRAGAGQLAGRSFIVGPTGGPELSGPGDLVLQVLGSDGQRLEVAGPGAGDGPLVAADPHWITAHTGEPVTVTARGGQSWRVLLEPVRYQTKYFVPSEYGANNYSVADASRATAGQPGTLVVGTTLAAVGQRVARLSAVELGAGAAALILLAGLVAAVTRGSMSRLREVEELAFAAARGQWSRRLAPRQLGPEASGIARSLNQALGAAEETSRAHEAAQARHTAAVARLSERLAEAGRQLRGPLSVINGLARHHTRRTAVTPEEADRTMRRVLDETTRMARTIDGLAAPPGASSPDQRD
jgi:hypothetical protein